MLWPHLEMSYLLSESLSDMDVWDGVVHYGLHDAGKHKGSEAMIASVYHTKPLTFGILQ